MRYFTPNPFRGPSLHHPAPAPQLPEYPRHTCEECLALCAWSSARLREAPLAEQVETLRHYPGLEPTYTAFAKKALRTDDPALLQESANELWRETLRRNEHRQKIRRQMPGLARFILA